MLKKIILIGAMTVAMSSMAAASGFYVGAGLGGITEVDNVMGDMTASTTGVNGTVITGYAWDHKDTFYLGLEGFYDIIALKYTDTDADGNESTTSSIEQTGGVRLLPGFHVSPDSVVYGLAGLVLSNAQLGVQPGAQFGLGFTSDITSNFAIRGDLIYSDYTAFFDDLTTTEADVVAVYKFG